MIRARETRVIVTVAAAWWLASSQYLMASSSPPDLPRDASPGWWEQVQESIRQEGYEIERASASRPLGTFRAANSAHRFDLTFSPTGLGLSPLGDAPATWSWGLELAAWGRPGKTEPLAPATATHTDRNRIELARGSISEWFVNSRAGLEQGFTIPAPPPSARGGLVLDLRLTGNLAPRFSSDGQAIDFFGSGSIGVLRYDHLKVTDSTGEELPSRFEPVPGGIRIAFDDVAAVYPITVDPLATSPVWTASGDEDDALFGYSVATAGDVNGDGYSDVIVGAEQHDAGAGATADRGRAYLYFGSASGPGTIPAWTTSGDEDDAQFGSSVATAGDVNGDGYSDVVVGAIFHDAGAGASANRGRVYVFLGSAAGLATSAAWFASGDDNSGGFGSFVAPAGDVNGDGYSDVLVGAPFHDAGGLPNTQRGRAYLYLGSAVGLAADAAWFVSGDEDAARLGDSIATAGDVNGDGYSDVVVGAYLHDAGAGSGADRGRAYVYLGSAAGLSTNASWTVSGDEDGAEFGSSVAAAGDVNGDGYSDVLIGAEGHDAAAGSGANRGRAYVFLGSSAGLATSAVWFVSGELNGDSFGNSVSTAGDINGDGYSDAVVGANSYDLTALGRAYLFVGSGGGLATTAAWFVSGDETNAQLGWSVATAGDVNGDGHSDLIVGAYTHDAGAGANANRGRAYVYLGTAAGLTTNLNVLASGDENTAQLGFSVASAGDVNGDGYSDVIVGAHLDDTPFSNGGQAYVFLGTASGIAATAAWTGSGDEAAANFGVAVASAGDVNGDGYADVIVGANRHDAGGGAAADRGRAYVYLGSSTGLATTASWTASGNENAALLGTSVASAGDVNGDGYSDVVVGANLHNAGFTDRGQAYVYLGSAVGLATTPAWTVSGDEDSANFGESVAGAGDVDGDGYSDVVVGAFVHNAGGTDRGRAYLFHGSATGLNTTPAWTASGDENSANFGHPVASAGDVNGDGFSDVVVGAHLDDTPNVNGGQAYVYLGSPAGVATTPVWTGFGDEGTARFGFAAASAGDVNGDGFSDLVVSAYTDDAGFGAGQDRGQAYLYLGSASGPATSPIWTTSGDEAQAFFGRSVASAGDVNGDGYADVVVGSDFHDGGGGAGTNRGRAWFFLGNEGAGVSVRPKQLRADLSAPISPLGLAFDRQLRLGLKLRTSFGRDLVKLEWQVAPLGASFDVVSNPIERDSTWWNSGVGGFQRNALVTLPEEPGPFLWRVRVRYFTPRSPFQSHGPWRTNISNGLLEADVRSSSVASPPPCVLPDEPIFIASVVKVGTDYTLNFQDPNQPDQRTGWNVRRSNDPVPPPTGWPLVGTNVVDMDAGTVNYQWTDQSGDDPAPSAVWYFHVTAFNANCPAEGPF